MKVCLIKNVVTNEYYLKKHRWHKDIHCESFFTERAAKWHKSYVVSSSKDWKDTTLHLKDEDIVIEEYEMIKVN